MAEPILPEPVVGPIRRIDTALELVPVYHATDPFVLAVIESALDAANLPFIVRGEPLLALHPYGGLDAGAEILVPAERREEAEALIRDTSNYHDDRSDSRE